MSSGPRRGPGAVIGPLLQNIIAATSAVPSYTVVTGTVHNATLAKINAERLVGAAAAPMAGLAFNPWLGSTTCLPRPWRRSATGGFADRCADAKPTYDALKMHLSLWRTHSLFTPPSCFCSVDISRRHSLSEVLESALKSIACSVTTMYTTRSYSDPNHEPAAPHSR